MSKATKRKHVTREVLDDFVTPQENQIIVKILSSKGNNLHEAETPSGDHFLISMPSKFRKNVWIKRGNFVIVDRIKEGHKVCGEIVHILYPEQIKQLKKESLWPEKFTEKSSAENGHGGSFIPQHISMQVQNGRHSSSGSESETDDADLFVNTNHVQSLAICSESESSEEDESDENEGNNAEQNKQSMDNNNINN